METFETVDEVLAHFGVAGMKWGVRRNSASGGSTSVTVRAVPGKKIKTSGGKGHPPVEEAVLTAVLKQKSKKSSTNSLTNAELQTAIRRMQLEQQFSDLKSKSSTLGKGKTFIKELLGAGNTGKQVMKFMNPPQQGSGQSKKSKS